MQQIIKDKNCSIRKYLLSSTHLQPKAGFHQEKHEPLQKVNPKQKSAQTILLKMQFGQKAKKFPSKQT